MQCDLQPQRAFIPARCQISGCTACPQTLRCEPYHLCIRAALAWRGPSATTNFPKGNYDLAAIAADSDLARGGNTDAQLLSGGPSRSTRRSRQCSENGSAEPRDGHAATQDPIRCASMRACRRSSWRACDLLMPPDLRRSAVLSRLSFDPSAVLFRQLSSFRPPARRCLLVLVAGEHHSRSARQRWRRPRRRRLQPAPRSRCPSRRRSRSRRPSRWRTPCHAPPCPARSARRRGSRTPRVKHRMQRLRRQRRQQTRCCRRGR